jgi:hypothetical protein
MKVVPFRGGPWTLCLNGDCPSMEEMKKRRAEREAAKAANAEMSKKPMPDGSEGDGAKTGKADTSTRRRKRAKAAAKS